MSVWTESEIWAAERERVARKRPSASLLTKAGKWFDARQRGERLPEHELPGCDFCDRNATPDDWSDVAGAFICPARIEAALANRQLETMP